MKHSFTILDMNSAFADAWFEYFWMNDLPLTDSDNGDDYLMGGEL